jgi:hypothetical protein
MYIHFELTISDAVCSGSLQLLTRLWRRRSTIESTYGARASRSMLSQKLASVGAAYECTLQRKRKGKLNRSTSASDGIRKNECRTVNHFHLPFP